jgi:hypothetical protein
MKIFLPFLFSVIIFSCSKTDEIINAGPPENNNTPALPPVIPAPYFILNFNGQPVSFTSIIKQRSLALKYFNVTAENDSLKIELKTTAVNQTGNSVGLILIGFYSWKLYRKSGKGDYTEYPTMDQRLGIFNDNPLTDSIVTGNFSFNTSIPGSTEINTVSNGGFRLLF